MDPVTTLKLFKFVRQCRSCLDCALKPYGITNSHWLVLYHISFATTSPSQMELARSIGIEQSSLVRTLDQLETKGIIFRKECGKDRRTKRLLLSDIGKKIFNEVNPVYIEAHSKLFDNICKEDMKKFDAVINKMQSNAENLEMDADLSSLKTTNTSNQI